VVLGWGFVFEGLMGSMVVVALDPSSEFESGMLDGLEAVAPCKLFFEGFDEALT
jgi:hypothetical protein